MKFGLASLECRNNDIEFNLSQIYKAMTEMQGKVDVLCFGETFLQGFVSLCWDYEVDKNIAVSLESPEIKKLCDWTKVFHLGLITGYIEIEKDKIYSSCIVINDGKVVYNYRRISKGWKEYYKTDFHYQEGDSVNEFELNGTKFMLGLCGDLWDYPERFKTENILIWPVYVNFSLEKWNTIQFDYAKQANKAASRTLLVNPIDRNPQSIGGALYFENGQIVSSSGFGEEKILVVDISTTFLNVVS